MRKTAPLKRVVCNAWMGSSETARMKRELSLENVEVRTTTFFRGIASLAATNLACAFFERVMRRTAAFFFAANRAAASENSVAKMLILFRPSLELRRALASAQQAV